MPLMSFDLSSKEIKIKIQALEMETLSTAVQHASVLQF